MVVKNFSQQQIKSLCDVLANSDPQYGLTESEIRTKLGQCSINVLSKGGFNDGIRYSIGLNKRDWLYNCLVNEINTSKSFLKIYKFLENALDPVCYTSSEKRTKYQHLLNETNKVLLLIGLEVGLDGKLHEVVQAQTLTEVDQRVKSLEQKLVDRGIHKEVQKYCISDYLRKDYHDAVFEAAKGVAQRVRDITGLEKNGKKFSGSAFCDALLFFAFHSRFAMA